MIDEALIRRMVRDAVLRAVAGAPSATVPPSRLVTQSDVESVPAGTCLEARPGSLVTPLARQAAIERGVRITGATGEPERRLEPPTPAPSSRAVAVAADHGGYEMKEMLKAHLNERGYVVLDCGTSSAESVDYPDYALAAARLVAQNRAWRGIVVDGAGIGSCIAANKVPTVRAAMCYDEATAVNSREHNDANVLALGAGMIGAAVARRIVDVWLETPSGGGRHARRVEKIRDIERRYSEP